MTAGFLLKNKKEKKNIHAGTLLNAYVHKEKNDQQKLKANIYW